MNSQHLIDHAEFDTAFAADRVSSDQQSEFAKFIKNDLMKVIDDVFEEIERKSSGNTAGLCLHRLEIDLGEIALADYRQQMPQRLRRQLWQALDNARYNANARISAKPGQAAGEAIDEPVLFYYLRHGYLPWTATSASAAGLDTQLQRLIETNPARLVEFIGVAARKDEIIERLNQQFPAPLVERVRRLLESSHTAAVTAEAAESERADKRQQSNKPQSDQPYSALADTAALLEERQARLQKSLTAGERAPFERFWLRLMQDDPAMLTRILLRIGNQATHRQMLARMLSERQFTELLRLLEPVAHGILSSVLEPGHWLAILADQSASGSTAREIKIREYLLGYLLVESGARFAPEDFVESLLGQVAATDRRAKPELWSALRDQLEEPAQSDGISGELARLMVLQVEQLAGHSITPWTDAYRRYARVEAIFSADASRQSETQALADIDALIKLTPWLLLGLLRKLQIGGNDWRRAMQIQNTSVLEKLSYSFLALINQSVAAEASTGTADLVAQIRRNSGQAPDPRAYYADILACLISGDAIDFDSIGASPSVDGRVSDEINRVDELALGDESDVIHLKDFATTGSSEPVDFDRLSAIENLSPTSPRTAQLLQFAELITLASLATGLKLSTSQLHAIKWRFVESYAGETGNLFSPKQVVRGFVAYMVDQAGVSDTSEFYSLLGQALLQNSLPTTREPTRQMIEQINDIAAESSSPIGAKPAQAAQTEAVILDELFDQVATDEDIYIGNAGLVLLAPWLPRLFDQLGFVEDGAFKDRDTAERAVHCLQFLIDGSLSSPEYKLVLNKILCGVKPGQPIRRRIELSADETGQLESLLEAITQHWKALENTSIDGLRESFLQRGGRLQRKQNAWHLAVETRAFDMLLDQIPWSYATIKFGWMDRVIFVDWR